MQPATQEAYESILSMYTPLDIKDIITIGASRKAKHHKTEDDILSWYAEFNEGLHHNLLDSNETVMHQYLFMQKCYNLSDKSHDDQYYFIRDIIWLYIDAVAMELATEYVYLPSQERTSRTRCLPLTLSIEKHSYKS